MDNLQYNRQKLYYRWDLILCITALFCYSLYFLYERYINGIDLFSENVSIYYRIALMAYYSILLVFLNKLPQKIYNVLGFLIVIPLSWTISVISFVTIGYEGITVSAFIFIILSSAIIFDFTVRAFFAALILMITFHFTLLSFYSVSQPEGLIQHIFLFGLSGILGLTTNYLVNIIKKSESKILEERELLLKEIHHRVKNNLQLINSLLNLQAGSISDTVTKAAVVESQNRVKSMALIHQLLYESDRFSAIDFPRYLNQLAMSLYTSYRNPDKEIQYRVNTDIIKLDIDKAIPLGLITNELVTNAFKYAFVQSNTGLIEIELKNGPENKCILKISDNGHGLPPDFSFEHNNTLGLKLVRLLVLQINGKIEINCKHGTEFIITF